MAGARMEIFDSGDQKKSRLGKRLVVPLRSVVANFKEMLYPYRKGASLPETRWGTKTKLTITSGAQSDTFTFRQQKDGRTLFDLKSDRGVKSESFRLGDDEEEILEEFE
jgi:hypothetical protein